MGIGMKRKHAVVSLVHVSAPHIVYPEWGLPSYQNSMYPTIDPLVSAEPEPILFGIFAIPGNIACSIVLDLLALPDQWVS